MTSEGEELKMNTARGIKESVVFGLKGRKKIKESGEENSRACKSDFSLVGVTLMGVRAGEEEVPLGTFHILLL